jgi:pilus assembly protein Flp/PilA
MQPQNPAFTSLKRFLSAQSGSTAVEYGLIIGLIALGLVGLLSQMGDDLNEPLNCSRDVINGQDKAEVCK